MVKHVLVPIDGLPQSVAAARFAVSGRPDTEPTLLDIISPASADYKERTLSGFEEWFQVEK